MFTFIASVSRTLKTMIRKLGRSSWFVLLATVAGAVLAAVDIAPAGGAQLEWVKGEILANVWQTNWIVRIDPGSGRVVGAINCAGLLKREDFVAGQTDVLNGIA
jgi:glutamine cyclotransferase